MNDICMLGLPKAGKTSIIKVIFQKMQMIQTQFLDPTIRMETVPVSLGSQIKFNIYDFSGSFDISSDVQPPEAAALENCGLMIFVIDGQADAHTLAIQYLRQAILQMRKYSPNCLFHILIHKVDPEPQMQDDEKKNELVGQVQSQVNDELTGFGIKNIQIDYHLTTIYDHCLFEQFSKVVQKIIPYSQSIQTLLDQFNLSCKVEKSYLFEIVSKLYIASDSQPINIQNFQLCSEMIDVFIDITCIYGPLEEQGQSVIKLSDGTILIYKSIEKLIALVCVLKSANYDRPFLLEHNMDIFRQGLAQLFKVK